MLLIPLALPTGSCHAADAEDSIPSTIASANATALTRIGRERSRASIAAPSFRPGRLSVVMAAAAVTRGGTHLRRRRPHVSESRTRLCKRVLRLGAPSLLVT